MAITLHRKLINIHSSFSNRTLMTDLRSHFSLLKAKRTITCAYGFVFCFIAFTVFLAFIPSPNTSSTWFTNIFATSFSSSSSESTTYESYRSHFSSVLSHFFPNSSSQVHSLNSTSQPSISRSSNNTLDQVNLSKDSTFINNQTKNRDFHDKVANFKLNQSTILAPKSNETVNTTPQSHPSSEINKGSSSVLKNQTHTEDLHKNGEVSKTNQVVNSSPKSSNGEETVRANGDKNIAEKAVIQNFTPSLSKKRNNGTSSDVSAKQGIAEMVKTLMNCDLYDGNWVKDESYPLYKPNSCSLIDERFKCFQNGRPDNDYYKLKWKPKGCTIPRLNGTHMLELLRGKRLVFVGDSLNRNMWESLICILKNSVKHQKKVYEKSGKDHFRGEASSAFIFGEYKCSVEYFRSPFLVQPWQVTGKDGTKRETLRLDLIVNSADTFKTADFILFNTGHWWNHYKTSLGKDYYQEGSHVYSKLDVLEAFQKALTTWGRWVDANVNPSKTRVMFRGFSASHYRGGQWKSGGKCDHETEPIKNDTYLTPYPAKMTVLEKLIQGMKTHVSYLNITRMSDYRKDGHPSIYLEKNLAAKEQIPQRKIQDCSHWCLPGVPDAWNELLYAELLVGHAQKHQH